MSDPAVANLLPPGFMPEDEAQALAELARDKLVLEIGSFLGRSTVAMARTARCVVAIDHHHGNAEHQEMQFFSIREEDGSINTARQFLWNLKRFGVADKVVPVVADFRSIDWLRPWWFDMAFVDCEHDYETTLACGRQAAMYTRPHGLVVFHDYDPELWPETVRAVDELAGGAPVVRVFKSLAHLPLMQAGVQEVPRTRA